MAKKKETKKGIFKCENCGFEGDVDEQSGTPVCPVCHWPVE